MTAFTQCCTERRTKRGTYKPGKGHLLWSGRQLVCLMVPLLAISVLFLIFQVAEFDAFNRYTGGGGSRPWASAGSVPSKANSSSAEPEDAMPHDVPEGSQHESGCMPYDTRLWKRPGPLSKGKFQFPYMRPPPTCRTFNLSSLETAIEEMRVTIRDPDLFRLFENTYPNTLDTMVKWYGYANRTDPVSGEEEVTDEELTYIITGDIDAMWLRDSAAQMHVYRRLLCCHSSDQESHRMLARLWRGLINLQARYVLTSPYCHSFQPPRESGLPPTNNTAYSKNHPYPAYDRRLVFDCKWELDSLAAFLQLSAVYYERTGDGAFFGKFQWVEAVEAAVEAAAAMRAGTYDVDGRVLESAWTFTGWTDRGTKTLSNNGLGNPSRANGMVRSGFRPSDDACIFQFLVPSNMMWAASLERAAAVMAQVADGSPRKRSKAANLTSVMREFARGVRAGIDQDAVVHHRTFGDIFAYEVDGYGGVNLMDDANIPSLLSIPLLGYLDDSDTRVPTSSTARRLNRTAKPPLTPPSKQPFSTLRDNAQIYANTRRFALSAANPYFAWGEPGVLAAVGGPHTGPGTAWPMAAIVAALTASYGGPAATGAAAAWPEAANEVASETVVLLRMLLNSTAGAGVMHESVDVRAPRLWTRPWFGWANGLFGELVLAIAENDAALPEERRTLQRSWQE